MRSWTLPELLRQHVSDLIEVRVGELIDPAA